MAALLVERSVARGMELVRPKNECHSCSATWPRSLEHPSLSRQHALTRAWLFGHLHEPDARMDVQTLHDVAVQGDSWSRYWLVQAAAGALLTKPLDPASRLAVHDVLITVAATGDDAASELAHATLTRAAVSP